MLGAELRDGTEHSFQVCTLKFLVETKRELLVQAVDGTDSLMGFLHQPYLVTSKQVLIHKGAFVRGEDELGGDGVGVFEKELHEFAHQGRMQAALHLVDEENYAEKKL